MEHYEIIEETLRLARSSGVRILAGTDVGNPLLVPRFSLQDELALLIEAGLSPADALRTATVEPARFFERDDFGLVADGLRADLVLLDSNPLEDIGAILRIHAVVLGGEWLDRGALDAMLGEVRARVSN